MALTFLRLIRSIISSCLERIPDNSVPCDASVLYPDCFTGLAKAWAPVTAVLRGAIRKEVLRGMMVIGPLWLVGAKTIVRASEQTECNASLVTVSWAHNSRKPAMTTRMMPSSSGIKDNGLSFFFSDLYCSHRFTSSSCNILFSSQKTIFKDNF